MCKRSCRLRQQQNRASRPFDPRCQPKPRYDGFHTAEPSQQQRHQQRPVWFPTQPGTVTRSVPAPTAAAPVAPKHIYEQQHPLGTPPPYTPSSDGILDPPASYGKGDGGRGLPSEGPDFQQHAGFDEGKCVADDGLPLKRKSALGRFTGLFDSLTGDIKHEKGKGAAV